MYAIALHPEDYTAERTYDPATIYGVIESLWDDISEDGDSLEGWVPKTFTEVWINLDGHALFNFHPENLTTLTVHCYVLKPYRNRAPAMLRAVWAWFLDNMPEQFQKVNCYVPVIYPHIRRFAVQAGLTVEGRERQSYRKKGEIVDRWLLGITREEMRIYLEQSI